MPPTAANGTPGEHAHGVRDPPVGQIEEDEDGGQRHRDDEEKTVPCALQVFELAAELDPRARRHRHAPGDRLFGIVHERAHVAAADVGLHHDAALAPLPVDGRWPLRDLDTGEARERNALARRRRHQHLAERLGIRSIAIFQLHDDGEPAVRFAQLADFVPPSAPTTLRTSAAEMP
jgi:hypothetical protein